MTKNFDDLNLFGYDPPAQRHSPTSQAAAEAIKKHVGPLHKRILAYLEYWKSATDEQMQDDLRLSGSTQRPRRRELQQMGKIKDSGRTALTRSGRAAVVWVVT